MQVDVDLNQTLVARTSNQIGPLSLKVCPRYRLFEARNICSTNAREARSPESCMAAGPGGSCDL